MIGSTLATMVVASSAALWLAPAEPPPLQRPTVLAPTDEPVEPAPTDAPAEPAPAPAPEAAPAEATAPN